MKESDAKTKWCPQAQVIVLNRKVEDPKGMTPIGSNMPSWKGTNCIGSGCMAWTSTMTASDGEKTGYCGLAPATAGNERGAGPTH